MSDEIEETESTEVPNDIKKLRAEAGKYRTRLRAAEERNATYERQLALRAATDAGLHRPEDFTDAVSLDDLRAEDGSLDLEAVNSRVSELLEEKPYLAKLKHPDFHQGNVGLPIETTKPATWSDFFNN